MSLEATKDREIKRDPRTGIFHYRGTPIRGGKEIIRSLGVRTFGSAVLQKKDLLLRLRGIDPGAKDILFRDYVKVFLAERKKRARATYEQAFYCCNELLPFFESYTMRQLTDRAWEEYKAYQAQVKPGRSLRYDRRHIQMMLLRLKKQGVVSEMPELPYEDEGPKRKRVLTPAEVDLILTKASPTLYGLVLFMYKMGPRPGEVLGASWSEFDLQKGLWEIPAVRTKTRTTRTIKLNQAVWEWLKNRKEELRKRAEKKDYKPIKWVFPSKDAKGTKPIARWNKQWKRLMEDCGIEPEITPYYLRHTFLSECAKRVRDGKLSLVLITKYAGTSIEMFEKTYLHVEGEETKAVADLMDGEI